MKVLFWKFESKEYAHECVYVCLLEERVVLSKLKGNPETSHYKEWRYSHVNMIQGFTRASYIPDCTPGQILQQGFLGAGQQVGRDLTHSCRLKDRVGLTRLPSVLQGPALRRPAALPNLIRNTWVTALKFYGWKMPLARLTIEMNSVKVRARRGQNL